MNFKGSTFIFFHILLLSANTQAKSWHAGNYVPPFHDIEHQPLVTDNSILNIPIPPEPPITHEGLTVNEEPQLLSVLPKKYEYIGNYSQVETLDNKVKPVRKYPQNIRPKNNETLSNNNASNKQKHIHHSNNNNNVNKKHNDLNSETKFLQQLLDLLNSKQNDFNLDSEQKNHTKLNANLKIPLLSESSEKKEGLIQNQEPDSLSVIPKKHDTIRNVSLIDSLARPLKKVNTNNRHSSSFIKSIKINPQIISPLNNEANNISFDNNTQIKTIHLNPNNNNNKVKTEFSNFESGSDIMIQLLELINSRQNGLVLQDSKVKSKLNGTQSHAFNGGNKPNEKSSKQTIGNKQGTAAQNLKTFIETLPTTENSNTIKNNTEYLKDLKPKNQKLLQNDKGRQNQNHEVNLDYLEEITKLFNQQNARSQITLNSDLQFDPDSLKRIKEFLIQSENGDGSNESIDLDQAIKREPKSLKMLADLLRIPNVNDVQNKLNVKRKKKSQKQQLFSSNSNYDDKINLEKIQKLYSILQQRKYQINNSRYINQMLAVRNSPLLSYLNAVSALQARLLRPQNFTSPNTKHLAKTYQAPFRQVYSKQPNYSQEIPADQQTSEDFLDVLSNLNINKDSKGAASHPSYECELGSVWRIGCHKCICSAERKFLCINKPDCKLSDEIKEDNASGDEAVISSIFP